MTNKPGNVAERSAAFDILMADIPENEPAWVAKWRASQQNS